MKGKIVSNQGESRYQVAVDPHNSLLDAELARLQYAYDQALTQQTAAQEAHNARQRDHAAAMSAVHAAQQAYQDAINAFDAPAQEAALEAACEAADDAARQKCRDESDGDPGRLMACYGRADQALAGCLAQVPLQVAQLRLEHQQQATKTYRPAIEHAQKAAATLLPEVQKAALTLALAKARVLSTAMELDSFRAIEARQVLYTAWSAQRGPALSAGTAVEVAKTPAGRTVITNIKATENCLFDARTLPPRNLLVNAAMVTGAETWRPTWRTGVVTAIDGAQNTLTVTVDPAVMTGSLGQLGSEREIDCTPPQVYFDGDWAAIEGQIAAARAALTDAQTAASEARQALAACIATFDRAGQLAASDAHCDLIWSEWLQECLETGDREACLQSHAQSLALCKLTGQGAVEDAQRRHEITCQAQHRGAIAAADAALTAATTVLRLAESQLRAPANPLVLTLPVEHCTAKAYRLNDAVLIDFPARGASAAGSPMTVWDSARVIGWAQEPRACALGLYTYSGEPGRWRLTDPEGKTEDLPTTFGIGTQYWHNDETLVHWSGNSVWVDSALLPATTSAVLAAAICYDTDGPLLMLCTNPTGQQLEFRCRPTGETGDGVLLGTGTLPDGGWRSTKPRFMFSPDAGRMLVIAAVEFKWTEIYGEVLIPMVTVDDHLTDERRETTVTPGALWEYLCPDPARIPPAQPANYGPQIIEEGTDWVSDKVWTPAVVTNPDTNYSGHGIFTRKYVIGAYYSTSNTLTPVLFEIEWGGQRTFTTTAQIQHETATDKHGLVHEQSSATKWLRVKINDTEYSLMEWSEEYQRDFWVAWVNYNYNPDFGEIGPLGYWRRDEVHAWGGTITTVRSYGLLTIGGHTTGPRVVIVGPKMSRTDEDAWVLLAGSYVRDTISDIRNVDEPLTRVTIDGEEIGAYLQYPDAEPLEIERLAVDRNACEDGSGMFIKWDIHYTNAGTKAAAVVHGQFFNYVEGQRIQWFPWWKPGSKDLVMIKDIPAADLTEFDNRDVWAMVPASL